MNFDPDDEAGVPSCPACEGSAKRELGFRDFALWRCAACELSFVHPRGISRKPFDADYLGQLVAGERPNIGFFERELRSLRAYLPGAAPRVLDVGFGAGTFLALAERAGAEAHGLEVSKAACDYVRRRCPGAALLTYGGDLRGAPLTPRSFDIVTFWDSLQYMERPLAQLAAARDLLKPAGILAVQVPRRDRLCLRYARALCAVHSEIGRAFLHLPAALYLFTERFLRRSLGALDLTVIRVGGNAPRIRPARVQDLKSAVTAATNVPYALLLKVLQRPTPLIVYARRPDHVP